MKIAIDEQIRDIIMEKFDIEERVSLVNSFVEEGIVTSMQLIELLYDLEDVYDVEFDLNDLDMNAVESPAKLADYINTLNGFNDMNIRDFFLRITEEHREENAIVFDDVVITHADLRKSVELIVGNMIDQGVKKGTRVAIILSNSMEYILSYFALFYIGAWPIPINTRWEKSEVFNILDDAEPEFIISAEKVGSIQYGDYVAEYIKEHSFVKRVYFVGKNVYGDKGEKFSVLYQEKELDVALLSTIGKDDPAMISYTSGTTGVPKGVILKHNDIIKISKISVEYWIHNDEERPFSIAPLYSAQGFLSLIINFATENCFKMISSFNPNDILKQISKCEDTIVHTQPTMWTLLLNCRIVEFTRFDKLNKLIVSGSLCSPELAKRIEKTMGCTLLNAYGLIESTSVVTLTRPDDPEDVRFNTVGRPIQGVEIKIVNHETREEVSKGEVGELAVRGYNMVGYYKKPNKTVAVKDEDGWLYTGDLAKYYDEENISIVGRCKDMIIRGGFNVYPSDIEEYILQLPTVQTVAVVGHKHETMGEEIVAYIVPKAGVKLTDGDVLSYLFKRLANYKIPDKICFISEMPIILAGKIDKAVLMDWTENGVPQDKMIMFD